MISSRPTHATIYREVIGIQNRMAPAEVAALPLLGGQMPWGARWLIWKTRRLMRCGHPTPREFAREDLSTSASLYRGKNGVRNMLVVFCGNAGRPMLPVPAFLQFIPDNLCDVLLLRDPSGRAFLDGVPGSGSDLGESLSVLGDKTRISSYRSVRTLGTSSGGAASLYAGLILNAEIALCVAGQHPSLSRRAGSKGGADKLDNLVSDRLGRSRTQLLCLRAEAEPKDAEGARSLLERLPNGRELVVPGTSRHGILCELALQGNRFRPWRRNPLSLLFADVLLAEDGPACVRSPSVQKFYRAPTRG